jgi:hypothetical protein
MNKRAIAIAVAVAALFVPGSHAMAQMCAPPVQVVRDVSTAFPSAEFWPLTKKEIIKFLELYNGIEPKSAYAPEQIIVASLPNGKSVVYIFQGGCLASYWKTERSVIEELIGRKEKGHAV